MVSSYLAVIKKNCSSARNMDAFKLMKELKVNHEQEVHYLPKEMGLSLIESTVQVSMVHSGQ